MSYITATLATSTADNLDVSVTLVLATTAIEVTDPTLSAVEATIVLARTETYVLVGLVDHLGNPVLDDDGNQIMTRTTV